MASAFFQLGLGSISGFTEILMVGGGSLVLSVVFVLLANILPQGLKHKLVFTRLTNELPACRADALCKKDSRLEFEKIKVRWPEVFSDEIDGSTRNSRWYQQIYKTVKNTNEVLQAHRSFLLYRDAFSGQLLIFIMTLLWALFGSADAIGVIKPSVFAVQIILIVLSLVAARVSGNRLVTNAVVAAE